MSLSKFRETGKDRETYHVHGVAKGQAWLSEWRTTPWPLLTKIITLILKIKGINYNTGEVFYSCSSINLHLLLTRQWRLYLWKKVKESEVAQSCPTVCDPVDRSLQGSSVHGILLARILEWVATSFSRGSSQPRDQTQVSRIGGSYFNLWATRKLMKYLVNSRKISIRWTRDARYTSTLSLKWIFIQSQGKLHEYQ